jgi:hypothetical protein
MGYLDGDPWQWKLGWGIWMLCALSLALFMGTARAAARERHRLARLAFALALAGAALDLACDTGQAFGLPMVAAAGTGSRFVAIEHLLFLGGTVGANTMYGLATIGLTIALPLPPSRSPAVAITGVAAFLGGMVITAAGLGGSVLLLAWATGPTVIFFCLWTFAVARDASS